MASASAGALAGTRNLRMCPHLLLALLNDCLPLLDNQYAGLGPPCRPVDLAYAVDAVHAHGLLTEHDARNPSIQEEWRAAVDTWVERLLSFMDSNKEYNCWVGTSFLGFTFQECSDVRFVKSYSDWFQKVLGKMQAPSCMRMVSMSTCISMNDLFIRLSTFPKLKNEATTLARKVIKPLLRLLDEDGPVTEKASDLLGLLMKLFPSSLYRHFSEVEYVITTKIMSGQYNLQQSKKLAGTLALLPCVRISRNSMSLMIQKILDVVNSVLNDTFLGHEEVTPIGGHTVYGHKHILSTAESRAYVVRTISALIHVCSMMLTSSYPIQVAKIPVRALITLIQKVLLSDGSLHKSWFQSTTPLYQELIGFEIPTLHSIFLDLLASTIKGTRSSLVPHAGIVVTLIVEYFKIAKLPSLRRKLYTVVRLLLSSLGVGMVMQLLQAVISNIFADLDDNSGSNLISACIGPIEATFRSSSKGPNMEQRQRTQSSTVSGSESTSDRQMMAPLCVKISALETLEVLLDVGGSFRAYSWRTEMDQLLIDVATNAYYEVWMYEQKPPWTEDSSISDFQLASFKALLVSFICNPHERPPYLEQGLELFNRGKLETDTELGKLCLHALLTLDVLIHNWQLPSHRDAHSDLGFKSVGTEQSAVGSGLSQPPCSVHKSRGADDLGDICEFQLAFVTDEPIDASSKRIVVDKHAIVGMPRMQQLEDTRWSDTVEEEYPKMDLRCHPKEGARAILVPESSSSRTGVKTNGSYRTHYESFDTLDDSHLFSVYQAAPIDVTTLDCRHHGNEISNKNQGGILFGEDASRGQNVPTHISLDVFDAESVCGSEWDSIDLLLGIGDLNFDLKQGW